MRATPYITRERLVADLGIYAMDTWTIKRMTVNAGLRWDYLNNRNGVQEGLGGTWIGPRRFEPQNDVPNWKDLDPRLGVAYDVFGNGKTALKGTVSRYVQTSTVATVRLLNPINTSVNNTTRPWTDVNGDSIPQYTNGCAYPSIGCELGALTNSSFGQVNIATRYDPDTITGWGKRRNNWEVSGSLTQELMSRVSADVSYFRRKATSRPTTTST